MTTSLRDVDSARMVSAMAAMGCYEYEYTAYGCSYLQEGEMMYHIGSDWSSIYGFIQDSAAKGRYPTPISEAIFRQATLSGTEEETKLHLKLAVGRRLQQQYNKAFFQGLQHLSHCAPHDQAGAMIDAYQEAIDGLFDPDRLQLLAGLVQYGFEAKVLTEDHYRQIQQWIHHVSQQMEENPVLKQANERCFYGFGQESANGLRLSLNASLRPLTEQRDRVWQSGQLVTPIFKKVYWYDHSTALSEVKQIALKQINSFMDEHYLSCLKAIHQLPAAINQQDYDEVKNAMESQCGEQALRTLALYGRRWHIKKT